MRWSAILVCLAVLVDGRKIDDVSKGEIQGMRAFADIKYQLADDEFLRQNIAPQGVSDPPKDCPPCFNCMLPAFTCKQFAQCNEYTGRCNCPAGFGGDDCSEPVCGSLADGPNRWLRNGTHCACDNGWSGINCNMCENDNVCDAFIPGDEKGICYKGGMLVNKNYQMCKVTNRKILDILKGQIPEVTFTCNRTSAACEFQFWVDERESFYCGLKDCEFQHEILGHTNTTNYQCQDIQCRCIPDRMLCGEAGSIDISDFLSETIKGPGHFQCDLKTKRCTFSEPSMNDLIKSVFGDPTIQLDCQSSECIHYTELPGYKAPEKKMGKGFALGTVAAAIVLIAVGLAGIDYFVQRSNKHSGSRWGDDGLGGAIQLPSDDESSKLMANHKPVALQFEGIGYTDNEKTILQGVFGAVSPGNVMAIMGGSGAGKTTLLDILAAKTKRGESEGTIYVNGRAIRTDGRYMKPEYKQYTKLLGFVDQDDCLMPTLTVYETVVTSALLRLPKTMTRDAKILRALETMEELGILGIKDQLIGNETNRGISGGEKRRVAIACELVTSPAILFLDEPTSGLDAYNAHNVVESLVHLARDYNRTVIFTIHQPRSNIVALFDQLVLLAEGRVVYSGRQADVTQHFACAGFECPNGFNVGDFLIDLTMEAENDIENNAIEHRREDQGSQEQLDSRIESSASSSSDIHAPPRTQAQEMDSSREWRHYQSHLGDIQGKKSTARLSASSNQSNKHKLSQLVRVYLDSRVAQRIREDIEEARQNAEQLTNNNDNEEDEYDQLFRKYDSMNVVGQFWILSGRTFKNLYRDPMLLTTHYCMAVLLGILCGYLYYNVTNDIPGFQNRLGLFFFLLALFGFSTLTILHLFAEERIIFIRERANGYYKPIAYYAAKVLFDIIPLRVLPPVLLGLIVYPLVGLNTEGYSFIRFLGILVLFNLTAASTCLVIGILIQSTSVASLVGCLVMLFSLLFAGLFLNQDSMPAIATWFKYISIFHYAYEALAVNEVRYLTLTEHKFGLSIEVPGATILSTFGFDSGAMWTDVFGLCGFFVAFIVAGYVGMHFWLVERR